ncbi:MAG: hypothetical protein Q9207_007884 [Kuettlingeria erythrocarpa]
MTLVVPAWIAVCFALYLLYRRVLLYIQQRKFQERHQCRPAHALPQYERLLGVGLMLENVKSWKAGRLLERLQSRFHRASNTYSATVAGNNVIFTIEPENVKAIFSEQFDDFDVGWIRRRAFAPSIGDVLITSDGAKWHQQRAMLRPAFNKQQYSDFAFYEGDIDQLLQAIPGDGSTIDLAPLFYKHALTLASRLLFDEPMATLNPDFAASSDRFIEAFGRVNRGNERRILLGRLLPLMPRDRDYEAGCQVIHEYGDNIVQRALAYRKSWASSGVAEGCGKPRDRYVFLQELAKEIDDPLELRNHLIGMLLVGSETTASLLTSCLGLLSGRPQLWARLRQEAQDLGIPTSESVKSFASLSNVINEALRLYPILPLFGRMANKDTSLPVGAGPDGTSRVFVPKGSLAMINTFSLHRRADIWGIDSNEFRPERWESKTPKNWSYFPFSGGPRVCIGREYLLENYQPVCLTFSTPEQYALMEVSYTMIRLLQVFPNIQSRDPDPWLESIGISLCNGNGAKVAFKAA